MRVREFSTFTPENSPHGKQESGASDVGDERLFWKIEGFDSAYELGDDDPSDLSAQHVLTIMLASEYQPLPTLAALTATHLEMRAPSKRSRRVSRR